MWSDDEEYERNNFGTFIQKTFPEFYRYQDDTSMVMTRTNSNFEKIIEYEKDRAVLVFNSSQIVGVLDIAVETDIADMVNTVNDPTILEKMKSEERKTLNVWNRSYFNMH